MDNKRITISYDIVVKGINRLIISSLIISVVSFLLAIFI